MFVDAFAGRAVDAADLSLARRLLTHPDAETIVASLIRDHLGAKTALEGDVPAEAAAARRGKNPPPVKAPAEAKIDDEPPTREEPKRDQRDQRAPRDRGRAREPRQATGERTQPSASGARTASRGAPHKTYVTWEPPVEVDDDSPILVEQAGDAAPPPAQPAAPMPRSRPEEKPLPSYTEQEDPDFAQIFVNVGRRDGAHIADFQRVLTDAALAPEDTGRIRIRDRNTFVSVRKAQLARAIEAFGGKLIAGRNVLAEPAKQRMS
jgi:ATP-dependent RNA helicase DeaD